MSTNKLLFLLQLFLYASCRFYSKYIVNTYCKLCVFHLKSYIIIFLQSSVHFIPLTHYKKLKLHYKKIDDKIYIIFFSCIHF